MIPFLAATATKVALLMAASAIVGLSLRRRAASTQHALRIAVLALSLIVPVAALALPQWRAIDVDWIVAPQGLPGAVAAEERAPTLTQALVFSWLGGACLLMLRELSMHIGLALWTRRASALRSPRWRATLDAMASDFPRARKLRPIESADVSGPCTWGFVQPVLLLPAAGNEWTENERRLALTHELAHIRRLDCLSAFIARLACAVHWYNPLVWRSAAEARRLQEQACDDRVLLSGARASDYATLLVALGGRANAVLGAEGIGGSSLHTRVRALLRAEVQRGNDNPWCLGALITMMVGGALVLASLAPAANAQRAVPTAPTQHRPTTAPVIALPVPVGERAPNAPHLRNTDATPRLATIPTTPSPPTPVEGAPPTPPVPVVAPTPVVPVVAASLPP